jgi:hypothetical protein
MYNTLNVSKLTKENVLEKVTEYDIYQFYLKGKFDLGKVMPSPFRKDTNPSFGIFKSSKTSSLLYKDHGTGQTGDCFKLVGELFGLTLPQTLKKIYHDLVDGKLTITTKGIDIKENYKNTNTIISVKKKNFTKTDDDFWSKYKVITRDTLKHFNIYPIQFYWVNGKRSLHEYSSDNPMYAYPIYNKFKIYSPYSDRKYKFISNCNNFDIQGLEYLEYNSHNLIITKSYKDLMVLYGLNLDYDVIAVNSESVNIPKSIQKHLNARYTNIYLLYDNDQAGHLGMEKLAVKTGYKPLYLTTKEKDISDYIENHTVEETKELINTLLN